MFIQARLTDWLLLFFYCVAMKSLNKIIGSLAIALSIFSCMKEPERNMDSFGELDINIYASVGDLTSADSETKASASQIVRLSWEKNDVVYAYDKTGCLGELKVTPTNYNRDAQLTGTIKAPTSSKITLVYCNASKGVATTGTDATSVEFDLSNQNSANDFFVVYATLDCSNQKEITNQTVPFYFATSLMKLTVTGLDDNIEVTEACIGELNTACSLSINSDGTPSISGANPDTIRRSGSGNFTTKDGGRAIFKVAIVDDDHTNRTITVTQGQKTLKAIFRSDILKKSVSYTDVYELNEHLRGSTGGHEFVVIAGKKWATMNLGATEVVGPNSYGDYYVAGTTETAYSSIDWANSKFVFKESNPYGDRFCGYWKADKGFSEVNMPFVVRQYDTSFYSKYDISVDNRKQLDPEDDAARALWGGDWRTPTASEFEDLITATYWAWDEYDKGFYVYEPVSDQDAGIIDFDKVRSSSYNKYNNALLFFPSAGFGSGTGFSSFQYEYAYYLTSTVVNYDRFMVMKVDYWNRDTTPWHIDNSGKTAWFGGFPVRPISDFDNTVPAEEGIEVGDYIADYGGGVVFKCDNDGSFYLVSLKEASNKSWEESKNWCETYGDGEWYMPNIEELSLLQKQLSKVNYTLGIHGKDKIRVDNICYWSSTDYEYFFAYRMKMSTGEIFYHGSDEQKTSTKNLVRAIRYVPGTE